MLLGIGSLPDCSMASSIAAVDGEFTVKYLRNKDNVLQLVAANPAYKPITFDGESELQLFGVVTAAIHQFVKPGK